MAKRAAMRGVRKPAWVTKGNGRRRAREEAVNNMNMIASDVGLDKIPVKSQWRDAQRFIRKVQAGGPDTGTSSRLHAAARLWRDNGGRLEGSLAPVPPAHPPAADSPALPKHTVLAPSFGLRSHGFMLTYNSTSFTRATWPKLRTFTRAAAQRIRATAC